MKSWYFHALSFLIFFACASPWQNDQQVYGPANCPEELYKTSLQNLKDSFAFYNGKAVESSGFFELGSETIRIKEHLSDREQNIDLQFAPDLLEERDTTINFQTLEECNKARGRGIAVRGIIDTSMHGRLGGDVFPIKKICFVEVLNW